MRALSYTPTVQTTTGSRGVTRVHDSGPGPGNRPGLEAGTERYDHAVVEGFTVTGEPVTVHATGFFARCLQHECDHLEGRVYVDHLTGWRKRRVLRQAARAPWGR